MKILVGISGGVDSAYCARLLLDLGHEVEGCILIMHDYSDTEGADRVASELGIPVHKVDLRGLFDSEVKKYFVDEYLHGRTPNPCIICNERVKFKGLLDFAEANGFDKIATGHYARIGTVTVDGAEKHILLKAEDLSKDQSYMLYRLPESILSKTLFPLGELTKDTVRDRSRTFGISAADAKDSQEICFLPNGGYPEYIESVVGKLPCGSFIDENGNLLGEHKGIIRYTVGQRKGLGIALGKRMFVVSIDPVENTVTLGDELKGKEEIVIGNVSLSSALKPDLLNLSGASTDTAAPFTLPLSVKIRYTAPLIGCELSPSSDGKYKLKLETSAKAAPGQSAVVYSGDRVVLGGIIE